MSAIWKSATLSEVCTKISDGTHHSPEVQYNEAGKRRFKYITSKNVRPWGLDVNDITYVDEDVHRAIYSRCNPQVGDVLLTKDGANTGNVAVNTLDEEFSLLSSVAVLKPNRDILEPRFLRYFIESPVGSKRLLGEMTGTAIRRIVLKKIKETEINFPPLPEQRQIVAEIEKQFTRLDAGIAALKRTQANLKRYRAAVLKAACEGRLVPTEAELQKSEARGQKSKKDYETGDQLLARILAERRQKWTGRGIYKEPTGTDPANLPPIPEGWAWATIDSLICEPLRNGHSAKATGTGSGLRVFTLSAVTEGNFSEQNTKLSVATPEKVADLWAEPGDIYVERSNTPELVGIARLYKGTPRFAFIPDLFIRVRVTAAVSTRYIEICLLSERGRSFFRSRAQGISGTMPKIDQKTVELAPIALPPAPEQARIVAEVERCLSVADKLEMVVVANLQRAVRLRQSILQQAFTGPNTS